jgi:hypothetical protein
MQEENKQSNEDPKVAYNVDPKVEPKEEPKEPPREYVCKFTIDGEVLVEVLRDPNNGNVAPSFREYPLRTVDLSPAPPALKEVHIIEMKLFHSLLRTIKTQYPHRSVPVTYKEFMRSGADPKLTRQLVELGYLKEGHVPLLNNQGVNKGSRLCLYYTPQGRALIRAKLDPIYAKTDYQ